MIDWKRYHPIFQPHEFTCKCGCGLLNISPALVDKLFLARGMAGIPFHISSACRCPQHNASVTAAEDSAHPDGLAADIRATNMTSRHAILKSLFAVGFPRIGLASWGFHADICSRRPQGVFFY